MQVPFTREVLNHVAAIRAVEHDRDILDSSAGQKALNAAWAQVPNDLADDVCEALEWVLATFHADMVA